MKNLLVAIEYCEATTIASPTIRRVQELADAFTSKVWLLHVVPPTAPAPFNVDQVKLREGRADELRQEHGYLQGLAQCLRDRGVKAAALLIEGPTVETLLDKARLLEADLIILGCHRHGPLFSAMLGAPGESLHRRCPCSIMFVPENPGG